MELAEVREKLREELDHLSERSDRLTSHLRREDGPLPDDWEERGTALSNDEVVVALDRKTRERIEALRGALSRIDDGTFGECVDCGKDIAPARLLAVPATRLCIKCAGKRS